MEPGDPSDLISSRSRLILVDLLSQRPRSLRELSSLTGITIQGVLRHLNELERKGVVVEKRVKGGALQVRKTYAISEHGVRDFSLPGLTIVKEVESHHRGGARGSYQEMETLAEDNVVLDRRVKERARHLGRAIDDLTSSQSALLSMIESTGLSDEERLILSIVLTEGTLDEAEKVLKEGYKVEDAKASIQKVVAKARRSVEK